MKRIVSMITQAFAEHQSFVDDFVKPAPGQLFALVVVVLALIAIVFKRVLL